MVGHIYSRVLHDGRLRWYAVIDVAAPGQPRHQVTRAFDTRRAARAWAAAQATARHARRDGPTVGEFLTGWLAGRVAIRPSTAVSYRGHIERHLIPELGHLPLSQLSPEAVERMHHRLLAAGMTPAPALADWLRTDEAL